MHQARLSGRLLAYLLLPPRGQKVRTSDERRRPAPATDLGMLDGLDGEPARASASIPPDSTARPRLTVSQSARPDAGHVHSADQRAQTDGRTSTRFCALFGSNCVAMASGSACSSQRAAGVQTNETRETEEGEMRWHGGGGGMGGKDATL